MRNIDCSDVNQIFAPFFLSSYVVAGLHEILHHFGRGQELTNMFPF